jgi:hypothetical protein
MALGICSRMQQDAAGITDWRPLGSRDSKESQIALVISSNDM